ncbi:hypothetical protein FACS1894208_01430 [Clostridia bacterium]|nr:hypothetical protein FACS1894208_01430 [Clostridia bacterium]
MALKNLGSYSKSDYRVICDKCGTKSRSFEAFKEASKLGKNEGFIIVYDPPGVVWGDWQDLCRECADKRAASA